MLDNLTGRPGQAMILGALNRLNGRKGAYPRWDRPSAGGNGRRHWMRKVILGFYTSLDGYSCDEDNGIRDVMMGIDDPEQEEYFVSRLWEAGTFIMGRVTYEGMAGFWPTSSHPSAGAMNDIPKVVFSRTLQAGQPGANP